MQITTKLLTTLFFFTMYLYRHNVREAVLSLDHSSLLPVNLDTRMIEVAGRDVPFAGSGALIEPMPVRGNSVAPAAPRRVPGVAEAARTTITRKPVREKERTTVPLLGVHVSIYSGSSVHSGPRRSGTC